MKEHKDLCFGTQTIHFTTNRRATHTHTRTHNSGPRGHRLRKEKLRFAHGLEVEVTAGWQLREFHTREPHDEGRPQIFQQRQAVQPHELVAQAGVHGIDIPGVRPVAVMDGCEGEAVGGAVERRHQHVRSIQGVDEIRRERRPLLLHRHGQLVAVGGDEHALQDGANHLR